MLCNFWAVTTDFFSCEVKFSMEFARFCKKLLPTKAGLIALLNLLIIWQSFYKNRLGHGNRSTCFKWNPVQSSWSKSRSCPRNGLLLRFQIFQCWCAKPWKLHFSELIVFKVFCCQISCKWNAMFEGHVKNCIDWTSFHFLFKDFFSNMQMKIIIYCVTNQSSKTWYWKFVLNFKFSLLTSLKLMCFWMSIEQKICWEKISNSNLCPIQ